MDHHVDIDLWPDPEIAPHLLMSALFAKLHRALAKNGSSRIGVSFPGVDTEAPSLGTRLRLHGGRNELSALLATDWLGAMKDHVSVHDPAPVPAGTKHRVVQRVQTKSSPDRLRRRLIRRHGLDEHEAVDRIPDEAARYVRLPFVELTSASTGQTFKLFVAHGPMRDESERGDFSTYGLSPKATVPWF